MFKLNLNLKFFIDGSDHLENGLLRTVNKIEMCRLQGFPDNYCDILNEDKAQSLLGDGWTLPVIEHILSYWQYE